MLDKCICITFSGQTLQLKLQVDLGLYTSKLVNNTGEINRIESFLFCAKQC